MSQTTSATTRSRRDAEHSGDSIFAGTRETPDIETSSEDYAQRFSGRVGAWFLQVQEQAMLRLLAGWPRATILDVGGGHGQLTGALVREGHAVTVFGSDESCRRRIQSHIDQGWCRFTAGNLLRLPYPAKAFDVVVSVRLLPHMEDWTALVGELTRVARHAVVVDYPTSRGFNQLAPALFNVKRRAEGNTRPYRVFEERELITAFGTRGFTQRQRSPQFFWPMVLHRVMGQVGISRGLEGFGRATRLTRWFGSPVISLFTRMAHR